MGIRSAWLAVALTLAAALAVSTADAGAARSPLRIGLAGTSVAQLPVWLAAERTAASEGLAIEVLAVNAAGVAQAVASDSVDIGVTSLTTLVNAIEAGQLVTGFYAGFSLADLEWFAQPGIKSWADLRGKTLAITASGGVTEFVTRYVLQRHGLAPGRDVRLAPAGGMADRLRALQSGKVDAAVLESPFKWQASRRGFTRLGTQSAEVGAEWPRSVFWARSRFLSQNTDTVRALLRAHVRAVRLAKRDPDAAVDTMVQRLKYGGQDARLAYEEVVAGLNERGTLPASAMPVFWKIALAAGDVTVPWPESRFLDRRFIDAFDDWAPPR